jgi:hypothetical protein
MPKTIAKTQLITDMLKIFGELEANNQELIITDNNNPILIIKPVRRTESVEALFGDLQGRVVYHEAVDTPTLDEWANL